MENRDYNSKTEKRSGIKKAEQLGQALSTAHNKLRKYIIFDMMFALGRDNCHQCGEAIKTVEELSIEHIIPWLDSDDPKGLYFDLSNIAFSHITCNVNTSRRNTGA